MGEADFKYKVNRYKISCARERKNTPARGKIKLKYEYYETLYIPCMQHIQISP